MSLMASSFARGVRIATQPINRTCGPGAAIALASRMLPLAPECPRVDGGAAGAAAHRRAAVLCGLGTRAQDRLCPRGRKAAMLREWRGIEGARRFLDGNLGKLMSAALESACKNEHRERRLVRYSAEQLFAVVAAIDEYPHFLPWCKEGRILTSDGNGGVTAELSVGFKGLSEKYTSAVEMTRPREIRVAALDSTLFEELSSEWEFRPGPDENSCWLQFRVSFAFRNPLYNQVASTFKSEVASTMISAFERRCRQLYGPPLLRTAPP